MMNKNAAAGQQLNVKPNEAEDVPQQEGNEEGGESDIEDREME
jgi:hypothetical protein